VAAQLGRRVPFGAPVVDTSAFERDGRKLGVGSSAAAAVAAAGALFAHAGLPVDQHRGLLYAVAEAGHRAAQGGVGSGADVAVAVHGGCLQFERSPQGAPRWQRVWAPSALHTVLFWTGAVARTGDLVRAVQAFAGQRPVKHAGLVERLRRVGERFARAFRGNDAQGVVAAAADYLDPLAALGDAAEIPIVTPAVRQAAQLASELGGAAKPSGAGGGDVAIAFFADATSCARFAADCPGQVLSFVGFPGRT